MSSRDYENQLPIENFSLSKFEMILLIGGLVECILVQLFVDRKKVYNFFLGFQSSIQSQTIDSDDSKDHAGVKDNRVVEPSPKQEKKVVVHSVSKGEVDIVLQCLGMSCNDDEVKIPAKVDADDLFNLFEVESPRLDEVKEAFDVFDENRDGFIDAEELQKVLSALGLKEGSEVENCRRMIGVFDENGDGRIDFDEFVKLMENGFC